MLTRFLLLSTLLLLTLTRGYAQAIPDSSLNTVIADSLREKRMAERGPLMETVTTKPMPFQPNPKKSALFASILPGSGQLYNRQYWKAPIVYAGMAASIGFLIDNTTNYRKYRRAYIIRTDGDPTTVDEFADRLSSENQLSSYQDYYRRNLDLTYLLTAIGYAVQVMDALVYAHLKNFDVGTDISMHMAPVRDARGVSFGLVVNF